MGFDVDLVREVCALVSCLLCANLFSSIDRISESILSGKGLHDWLWRRQFIWRYPEFTSSNVYVLLSTCR